MTRKLTTEQFVQRAREKHGDRYDYSEVVYTGAHTKVKIICGKHGPFEQEPSSHIQGGRGCPDCCGTMKLNTKSFIEKATAVHGGEYDYSLVDYVNARIKITILCPKHGPFEQKPASHLSGQGCPSCSGNKKLDTKSFIHNATLTHGFKYEYSLVNYVNTRTKITIICPVHGPFEQSPSSHLLGNGCPSCGGNKKLDTKSFIEKATAVHGFKYSYDKVIYKHAHAKIKILCPTHGPFEQSANSHLQGNGCHGCAVESKADTRRATNGQFIEKAREAHGEEYDYSLVDYVNAHSKISVICPTHGPFEQTPNNHLQGKGCPSCANSGFNPDKPASLYILRATKFNMMKIGISNDVDKRLQTLRRETPFAFELITTKEFTNGQDAYDLEQQLHSQYESAGQEGFDGATEWFSWNEEVLVGFMAEPTR